MTRIGPHDCIVGPVVVRACVAGVCDLQRSVNCVADLHGGTCLVRALPVAVRWAGRCALALLGGGC